MTELIFGWTILFNEQQYF